MTLFNAVNPSNQKIYLQVAKQIGMKILSGELKEGERLLCEVELCRVFNISRTALRESTKLLSAKGLIHSKPKAGTIVNARQHWHFLDPQLLEWVAEVDNHEFFLSQFLGLRKAIEPEACALAAIHATADQRKELSIAFQNMLDASKRVDYDAWTASDHQFHQTIFQSTGNRFYVPFSNILSTTLRSFIDTSAQGERFCIEEHRAIYDAIMVGNPELARVQSKQLLEDENQKLANIDVVKP